ncbi:MAG: response regulator [Proteobacteria bacterium]|nr:response regulator [Pseudomonadota bacterium]
MHKILLVDDDKITVKAFIRQLKKYGYDSASVTSGKDAIDFVKREKTDVILLDQMMPDMDGIDTYKKIKAFNPRLPVIMVTGHGSMALSIEFMKLGGRDFIEKPFDFDILDIKIKQAIKSIALTNKIREMEIEQTSAVEIKKITNTIITYIIHELISPLDDIKRNIDALSEMAGENQTDKPSFIEKLEEISDTGDQLNLIINDLLETALIQKGICLNIENINFSYMMNEITDEISRENMDSKEHVNINLNIDENLPQVQADDQKLRKVLRNLIKNAFAGRESGVIHVSAWPETNDVIFSVCSENMIFFKDLTDENFERITDPYQTCSSFRFWIGFSIAHKLAELMGCRIWVERYRSYGSTVYLFIPGNPKK